MNRVGHYSSVPYRGCSVKITAQGKVSPMSCGFRQPNGLVISPDGELFATDNQGDWVGTSPLHHVTKGAFHGHPSSLNWDASFSDDPVEALISTLAERRKMPAIQFPQNDLAGSTAQPIFDTTGGGFGALYGAAFCRGMVVSAHLAGGSGNRGRRLAGGVVPFPGGQRIAHGEQSAGLRSRRQELYVAQTSRVWGGSTEGLQRIVWQGKTPMDILHMRLTNSGFELTFTKPADPDSLRNPAAYSFTHYYYLYHDKYGSPKTDVTPVKVVSVEVSDDGRRARLELDSLVAGRVYELRPGGIRSVDGEALTTRLAAYTLNRLRK